MRGTGNWLSKCTLKWRNINKELYALIMTLISNFLRTKPKHVILPGQSLSLSVFNSLSRSNQFLNKYLGRRNKQDKSAFWFVRFVDWLFTYLRSLCTLYGQRGVCALFLGSVQNLRPGGWDSVFLGGPTFLWPCIRGDWDFLVCGQGKTLFLHVLGGLAHDVFRFKSYRWNIFKFSRLWRGTRFFR